MYKSLKLRTTMWYAFIQKDMLQELRLLHMKSLS